MDELKSLFLKGNYKQVLARAPAVGRGRYRWVIGALCFTGRKEEAESLFAGFEPQATPAERAACRFFLGVSFCRHGQVHLARRHFGRNLRAHRSSPGELGFYAWQGLAFYRYFRADFSGSGRAALKALSEATGAGFSYGRSLALDLIGHSLVQQGDIQAGLARLSEARAAADRLGNGGLASSIGMSSLVYRAQFGLAPRSILSELKKARLRLDPQNSYAQANLLLEISNQCLLRGKIREASGALSEAGTLIYGSQHRRYAHLLALRFAEVAYRRGELSQALHAVQLQRSALDETYDRPQLLMALGMEIKLLGALGMGAQASGLAARLERMTARTERAVARAIWRRQSGGPQPAGEGEDRVQRVFESLRGPGAIHAVLRSGYRGLAYEALGLPVGSCWILAGKGELAVLENGEVTLRRATLPDQALRLLEALATGARDKAQLVGRIWGYAYHPLQHDPLLYQAIARLRQMLGDHGRLIEVTPEGYRLRAGFGFAPLRGLEPPRPAPVPALPSGDLNERQVRILQWLQKRQFLGVRDCLERFGVSDMTLKRDFSGLLSGGWVQRIGQARATRYTLKSSAESTTVRTP